MQSSKLQRRQEFQFYDSAESLGAEFKGKLVGSQCEAHSFSFFANKNITMGEGGLITTNDENCRHMSHCSQSGTVQAIRAYYDRE